MEAMTQFRAWLRGLGGKDAKLVFVSFNAPFDWSFINYYFYKYLGENPFGFSALDIKAYYMGARYCAWSDTRSSQMDAGGP
jgi:DNA polymerase III epsilon subunit-like protein